MILLFQLIDGYNGMKMRKLWSGYTSFKKIPKPVEGSRACHVSNNSHLDELE